MTTTLSPLQARANELDRLLSGTDITISNAAYDWISAAWQTNLDAAKSLLLAAIEAAQEPEQDQPLLWREWMNQAMRDGIVPSIAIRLALRATDISRQIFGTNRKD